MRAQSRPHAKTEPYGLALTPSGRRLYVTNARSNSVSVLDTVEFRVLFTIENVGPEPRGITITNNGDTNDNDELIYVTQFLAVDRPGVLIGRDDYKEGRVTVISVADNHVVREVVLNPIAETGFLSNGSALKQIPATNPPTFTVHTMGINGSYVVWTLPRGPANIKRISSRLQPNFQ